MSPNAFQRFFREMYPQAVRFAQSRLGGRQQAEDIVQDVFVRMWENRRKLNPDRSPKAYLFKLVANAIIDHYRHEKVKQRHAEHMRAAGPALTPPHDPALEEDILRAIDDLPEKESTVFRLNRFAGMTYAEAARYLGVSQKTVEKHMSRALARLGASLRDFLVILIALFTLAMAGAARGQDRPAETPAEFAASSVDIRLDGKSLRDALNAVAARTGAGVVFDDAMVESRTVGSHCAACPLTELLRDVLAPHGLAFELMDGPVIVVVRARGHQLTGRVVDAETGESLPLAQVWTGSTGAVADRDGWFSLTVPADAATRLTISYMGYEHRMVRVIPGNVGVIALRPRTIVVGEVTVFAEPVIPVYGDGSGARLMRGETMDRIPTIGGDDPLLAMQMLPGMDNTGERAGEMFIRGATPRTNLMTWDGIPVFSADHFFGMISTFSPQAVGEVKAYPRGVPAHLGGRAGTVVELVSPSALGQPQLLAHSSVLVSGASVRIPLGPRVGGWVSARRSTPAIEQQTAYSSFFDKAIGEAFEANRPGFTFSDVSARLDVLDAARHHLSLSLHTSDDGLDRNTNEVFRQLEVVNEQTEEEEEENENRGRGQGRGRGGDKDDDDDDEEESDDGERGAEVVETVVTERERTNNDWRLSGLALNWTAQWAVGTPMHVQVTRSRSSSSYRADLSEFSADTLAFSELEDRRQAIEQQAFRVRQELPSSVGSTTVGAFLESSRAWFNTSTTLNAANAFDSTSVRDMILAGGHVTQEVHRGPVRMQAGMRLTRISTNGAWYTAPRVTADITLTDRVSVQVFWGQYHQYMLRSLDSDILVERRDSWALVSDGQEPARSRQTGASVEVSDRAWSMSVDVWRRTSIGVPVLPEATPRADVRPFNGDETHTLGVDVGGQVLLSGVVALISYTYTESEARSPVFREVGWFRSLSERPHAVKGVVSAPLGPFTVGVSYSLASGRPVGVLLDPRRFVSADGSQLLGSAAASLGDERLPPYRRLDLDIEWAGRVGGLNMAAAVSAMNVLDRQNVRYRRIVTDGTSVLLRDVPMLGFTPTASLRIGLYRQ